MSFDLMSFNSFHSSLSVELFKEYITPKDDSSAPKQFTDCAKLYKECRAPHEQPIGVNMKRKQLKNKNQTGTPSVEETTSEADPVTQYVAQQRNRETA